MSDSREKEEGHDFQPTEDQQPEVTQADDIPTAPEHQSTPIANEAVTNGRQRKMNSVGEPPEIVDDSYYDGKWWRRGSYARHRSIDAGQPNGQPNGKIDGQPGAVREEGHGDDVSTERSQLLQNLTLKTSLRHDSEKGDGKPPKTPAEKVRFMLTPEGQDEEESDFLQMELRALFCQMDVLCHFEDGLMGWKEAARWLKYEEKVEAGDRWSKPHVPTTSLHALFELRRCLAENTCSVILDMNASHGCLHQVAELIVHVMQHDKDLPQDVARRVVDVLLKPHKHKHRGKQKGKNDDVTNHNHSHCGGHGDMSKTSETTVTNEMETSTASKKSQTMSKLRSTFSKKQDAEGEKSALPHTYPSGISPDELSPHKPNKRLMRKIPGGSEAANILVGTVDFLDEPIMAFLRLKNSSVLADLTEVAVPTRFLFLVLGPPASTAIWEYEEVGRAMASLFTDRVFCEVAYKASSRQDLLDGMDEFIDDLTVLPPSIWDPSTRLEPPEQTVSMERIRKRVMRSSRQAVGEEAFHFTESAGADKSLQRTGRLFGGLWKDIKRRYPKYWSDIKDGFHLQCLASIIFLYFACITPIVTFGGLLGQATDNYMGVIETMLAGAMCGLIWHTFSGQPLCIVGATGPMLIFEGILYLVCRDFGLDFLTFRLWVGIWVFVILMLIVAFDLSALVAYITRFTEESFAVLISLIFIFEAFKKLFAIWDTHPIHVHAAHENAEYRCHCEHPLAANESLGHDWVADHVPVTNSSEEYMVNFNGWTLHEDCITYQHRVIVRAGCIFEANCTAANWTLDGSACNVSSVTHSIPDVFFLCCFLFIGTFVIAYSFRMFRTSTYFPSIVRSTLSDFAVLIAILCCTTIDYFMDLDTPKLQVPDVIKPTRDDRVWMLNPMDMSAWWVPIATILPAILATILIFLDQQITAVIVNRKEHKLKKGHGYHLDLFVLSFSLLMCSFLGMPWFVAATVRAITHVRSLIKESELRAPGERPQFLGVREQRFTGICIHILIGLSVNLTVVLQHVPMAVLYGVFLYMGVTSLAGVQFVDRILILFMPSKNQPDHIYLRHVETPRVHLFTFIQITCMLLMWIVKSTKSIAILFPVMLIVLCILRKVFDFMFTQRELYWLDHILPDEHRKKKEDEQSKEALEEKEEEEPPMEGEWDQMTAKRDYGYGKKQRHRKLSEGIIFRYKREHEKSHENVTDAPAADDETDTEPVADPNAAFRERKFSIQQKKE